MSAKCAFRGVCALGLLAFALSLSAQPLPPVVVLEQAEAVEGEQALLRAPGPAADWRAVTLPDNWSVSRPGFQGVVWYRLRFSFDNAPPRVYAVHLRRHVATRYQVRVNGHVVGGTLGRPDARVTRAHPPLYLSIPYSLLRPGENEVLVRVEGDARYSHGLPRVYFGPSETLVPINIKRTRRHVQVIVIAGFLSFFAGLFAVWAWRASRVSPHVERSATGWLGLSALLIGMPAVLNFVIGPGEPGVWREVVLTVYTHAYAPPLAIALLRLARTRPRRLEWLLLLPLLVSTCAPLLVGPGIQPRVSTIMFACDVFMLLAATGIALASRALERGMKLALAAGAAVVSFISLHDIGVVRGWLDFDRPYLIGFVAPVLTFAAGAMLIRAYGRNIAVVASRRNELETMVAERMREVEAAHTELREITRREAVLKERARIMSDMHDGLGGSLVSTLSLVQTGNAAPREIETRLHELLTELRLTVDSLSLPEGDLVSVLASVRYRLRAALELSGATLRWEVEALPLLPGLTPQKLREVQLFCTEALTNALRHARANTITVSGRVIDGHVEIAFADDGTGFAPDHAAQGKGLPSLARRAAAIGGTLEIASGGQGTTLRLLLPLQG